MLNPNLASVFSQHVMFLRFFEFKFFRKIANRMIKICKKIFKRKAIHDFNEFFNAESIDFFWFMNILYSSGDN